MSERCWPGEGVAIMLGSVPYKARTPKKVFGKFAIFLEGSGLRGPEAGDTTYSKQRVLARGWASNWGFCPRVGKDSDVIDFVRQLGEPRRRNGGLW